MTVANMMCRIFQLQIQSIARSHMARALWASVFHLIGIEREIAQQVLGVNGGLGGKRNLRVDVWRMALSAVVFNMEKLE